MATSAPQPQETPRPIRTRPLPVRGVLRPQRALAGWHRPALSILVAMGVPNLLLLALGRLDLAVYTAAGAMCALYAHRLPPEVRARTLGWVVLGMAASTGIALTTAATTDSTAVRVAVAALLAALQKVVCDATRVGPPGSVIFTFIAASCAFLPQRLAEVPAHLGLLLLAGAFAWLVCMAPVLLRARTSTAQSSAPRPTVPLPRRSGALREALRPGSPLLPVGARVAIGCALAGWASMGLGVGRPYWAVVTAAAVFQANTTLTWNRAVHRVLGSLVGLALFVALLPLTRTGALALVLVTLLFQFGAEATITRGYWLAAVCVTQMSLLMPQFAHAQPAGQLIADRALDTGVGAVVGLTCCFLITNRRAADRAERALAAAIEAGAHAAQLLTPAAAPAPTSAATSAAPLPAPAHELHRTRRRLNGALAELREATDTANGEWWQRPLPAQQISAAEQQGHRLLAELHRHLDGTDQQLPVAA